MGFHSLCVAQAILLPIVGRCLQHHALLYVNILEMVLKRFRVETKVGWAELGQRLRLSRLIRA